ncbi:MAG: DUF3782 domain-containing protein [bacterium]
MEIEEIKEIIREQLPKIMQTDEEIARFILRLSSQYYAGKLETEDRFDRILNELQRDREEQRQKWEADDRKWEANERKWEEQVKKWEANDRKWEANERKWEEQVKKWEVNDRKWEANERKWEANDRKWEANERKWEANERKWEEQNKKWWENQKVIDRVLEELKVLNRKHDQSIGALGARWGLHTEASFRNALAGILKDTFNIQVLNITEFDDQGEVFGHPDQVELDLIIKNGLLIICEIKSSMSKADMYAFERKIKYYEKRHECKANRKIVISPMVDDKAKDIAAGAGIEVYSFAEDVEKI